MRKSVVVWRSTLSKIDKCQDYLVNENEYRKAVEAKKTKYAILRAILNKRGSDLVEVDISTSEFGRATCKEG